MIKAVQLQKENEKMGQNNSNKWVKTTVIKLQQVKKFFIQTHEQRDMKNIDR